MVWFIFTFFFTISNGVRQGQGGIVSPKIVALYMNGLTDELSNSYAGCYIHDKCINHIMYADDICPMAPTGITMQNLLDACHNNGAANDILFNPLKSVCIVYNPKYYKLFCPSVNNGSEPLRFVNEMKYLGFIFCNLNKDDKDILRQMRSDMCVVIGYIVCLVIAVLMYKLFYLTVIALPCTVSICGQNIRKRLLVKFE